MKFKSSVHSSSVNSSGSWAASLPSVLIICPHSLNSGEIICLEANCLAIEESHKAHIISLLKNNLSGIVLSAIEKSLIQHMEAIKSHSNPDIVSYAKILEKQFSEFLSNKILKQTSVNSLMSNSALFNNPARGSTKYNIDDNPKTPLLSNKEKQDVPCWRTCLII